MVATPTSSVRAQSTPSTQTRMPLRVVSLGQATLMVRTQALAVTTDNANANKLIDILLNHFIISLFILLRLIPFQPPAHKTVRNIRLRARVGMELPFAESKANYVRGNPWTSGPSGCSEQELVSDFYLYSSGPVKQRCLVPREMPGSNELH